MALDLTAGRRGLAALAEAMRRWIAHLLSVEVEIEPLTELREAKFTWYVGLDSEGSRIGDLLWNGEELDEATAARVVGLFRLTFRDPAIVIEKVRGEPVYLILAMTRRQAVALQAAEPRHRPAGPPSGGGHMSAAPHVRIPVGVVVERAKAASQWIDYLWRPVAVLAGEPDTAPWTKLTGDDERATLLCRPRRHLAPRHRDRRTIATISRPARRRCGSCCGRPRPIRPMSCSP